MKYLKITQYIYLVATILFLVDAFYKYQAQDGNYKVSIFFSAIALFMFFFRKRFNKKYEQNSTNKK